MIESFDVQAPMDVAEQRTIAHILGTLDDKIELNRRMNETLEEMARALFKSWFVDFDPVRAKMEGRDPGLPMAMNQTCYGIRGARGYPDFFTYWTIRKAVDELQSRTHGTIFDTITRQTFKIIDMILPPVNVPEAFECTVNPIMGHILNNLNESRTLAALRDTLLPKLVSGQLRVIPRITHKRDGV